MMKIKRTKNIKKDSFRKNWRIYRLKPITLAIGTAFMFSGCEQNDETVSLYTNAEDCIKKNPSQSEQCSLAYKNALQNAVKTSPKYETREDCISEFGKEKCIQTSNKVEDQTQSGLVTENQISGQSGSFWMPLMTGYMMGRIIGGGNGIPISSPATQPLFTSSNPASPSNGKFVDITGKNYGPAVAGGRTITVPSSSLFYKPTTTTTITRGGFGGSISKQEAHMKSKNIISSSYSSMGG